MILWCRGERVDEKKGEAHVEPGRDIDKRQYSISTPCIRYFLLVNGMARLIGQVHRYSFIILLTASAVRGGNGFIWPHILGSAVPTGLGSPKSANKSKEEMSFSRESLGLVRC